MSVSQNLPNSPNQFGIFFSVSPESVPCDGDDDNADNDNEHSF